MCLGLQHAGGWPSEGLEVTSGTLDLSSSSVGAVQSLRGDLMHVEVLQLEPPLPCLSGTESLVCSRGGGRRKLQCVLEGFSSGCSPRSGFLRRQPAAGGVCGSGSPTWPVLIISMGNVHPGGGRGVTRMGDDATSISIGISHLLRGLARLGKGLVGSIRCVLK